MFIAASVLATAGLSSCSNENDPGMNPPEGEKGIPTAMSLTLNMNGVQTRASEGATGLKPGDFLDADAGENKLKTLHVYIYDNKTGLLDQDHTLTYNTGAAGQDIVADNPADPKKYTTKALEAFVGEKTVYVGLNLTAKMENEMKNTSLQSLKTHEITEELANMVSATGFSMFSPDGEPGTFKEQNEDGTIPTENKIAVSVERMVAKIGLGFIDKTKLQQLGAKGTLGELKWVVDNIGKKFYMPATQEDPIMTGWDANFFRYYDFDGSDEGVTDRTSVAITDDDWLTVGTGEQKTWTTAYSTENFVDAKKEVEGMTRLVVKGTYTPDLSITYESLSDAGELAKATTAIGAGTDYYQLVVPGDNKYVFLKNEPTETGMKEYYNKVNKKEFDETGGKNITDECLKLYSDGVNYWWVTMKHQDDGNQDGNVERNHVYLANIKSIAFPGRTEGEFSQTEDKGDVLDKDAKIEVTVDVLDWLLVTFDTDLKP